MAALQKPIVLSTLATILGTRKDVGAVCTSGSINRWAKYKPIRSSKVAEVEISDREAVNYGFEGASSGNKSSMFQKVSDIVPSLNATWDYYTPRGKATASHGDEWYRMLDFNGYDANALPPTYQTHTDASAADYKAVATLYARVTSGGVDLASLGVVKNPRAFGGNFDKEDYIYALVGNGGRRLDNYNPEGRVERVFKNGQFNTTARIETSYNPGSTGHDRMGIILPYVNYTCLTDYAIILPQTFFLLQMAEEIAFSSYSCTPVAWDDDNKITAVNVTADIKNNMHYDIYAVEVLMTLAEGNGTTFDRTLFLRRQIVYFDDEQIRQGATRDIDVNLNVPYPYFANGRGWYKLIFVWHIDGPNEEVYANEGNWIKVENI